MFYYTPTLESLLLAVPFATSVMAALPPTGNYRIFNPSTTGVNNYWDVEFGNTEPVTPGVTRIIAQTLNDPPTTNQEWSVGNLGGILHLPPNAYAFTSLLNQTNDFFHVDSTPGAGAIISDALTIFTLNEVKLGLFRCVAIQADILINVISTNLTLTAQAESTQQEQKPNFPEFVSKMPVGVPGEVKHEAYHIIGDNSKIKKILGITFRPIEEAISVLELQKIMLKKSSA
ncbi:hypothetical protein EXIGLDRAFT_764922 [Exidia glandulosa HHB12029]|uniref:Ricin B lectin domain-containing protein n=1 Tax=Exidia glandulosa HHB12029 TaxID=1314781 RepID=A0A165KTF3_EXIGL|nr:hypothetical protein EXIGLDRAFT_764922 [Exidia glandulosa HHB12029]